MGNQQQHWRQWLKEAWHGIIGNTAYDVLKWIGKLILAGLGVVVGQRLVSWVQRLLGSAIPTLRIALSAEVFSTDVVVSVGTVTAVAIPTLALVIMWVFFVRKRRQAIETEVAKRDELIAELRGQLANQTAFLETQQSLTDVKSSELKTMAERLHEESTRVSKLTLAMATLSQHVLSLCDEKLETSPEELEWISALKAGEHASKCARSVLYHHVTKIVYYDPNYPGSWMTGENAEMTRKYFVDRWFIEKDAQQLRHWISDVLKSGLAYKSLIVFAQDIVPDTVVEVPNDTCLLRKYLDAGGRVVWRGDIPFWRQGKPTGAWEEWFKTGPWKILGIYYHNYGFRWKPPKEGGGYTWDSGLPYEITEIGKDIGLSYSGKCTRPVPCEDVDFTYVLIRQKDFKMVEAGEHGCDDNFALCWKKNFNKRYPHSGFMQYVLGEFLWRDDTTANFFNFTISGWPLFFD